jgi:hypothetical protein
MKRFLCVIVCVVATALLVNGCKKSSNKPTGAGSDPLPTSFFPASGLVYSTVTINGSGFDTVKSDNAVTINGIKADVLNVTPTQIIVTVPPLAKSGVITVSSNKKTTTLSGIFKVLHLVETDSVYQYVSCLLFDKSGNMFGIHDKSVVKFANGSIKGALNTIYTAPNDSTVNSSYCGFFSSPSGRSYSCYLNYYTYTLTAATIANNNLYVSQQYKKNIFSSTGYSVSYSTSILKIDPSGQVSIVEKNIPQVITSITSDPSGNIYFVGRSQPNIYKIDPAGDISVFAPISTQYFGCIGSDTLGNIYAIYGAPSYDGNDDIATFVKFNSQGIPTGISGPTLYPLDFFSTMFFDASGNMVTTNNENLLLINPYGYVSKLPAPPIERIYTDNLGNWYEASGYSLVKFELQ